MEKTIAILGSTGSIGTQTLEVVRENQDIRVAGLSAGSNITLLEKQIREFHPSLAAVWDEEQAKILAGKVRDLDVKVVSGMDGLLQLAQLEESQILVTAIVGMIGIRPTIAAIQAGKDIALANKETLVTAGHLIMPMGRPRKDNRILLNGMVWLARSGAPWRDLPERYGSWQTVYSRFRKWIDDGILDNIFRILSLEAELEELSIDASIVQAHQHSAGAKKGGPRMKSDTAVEEPVPKSMQ